MLIALLLGLYERLILSICTLYFLSIMDKDLKMLHRLIKFADKEIAKQNAKTEILIDQFNNSKNNSNLKK